MKIIKNLVSIGVLLSMVFVTSVYAGATEYTVKRAAEQNEIVVSGKTDGVGLLSVQILPKGLTPDDIQKDNAKGAESIFTKIIESDQNGAFQFQVKVPKSNEYVAYIRSTSDKTNTSEKFAFALEEEKDAVVATVIQKLNQGQAVDIASYIKDFNAKDAVFTDFMDRFVHSDAQSSYFASKMTHKNIVDYNDLLRRAKEALILSAAKDSDGPANLREVMEAYQAMLGISPLTDKLSVYTAIRGEYDNIEDLKKAYDNAVKASAPSAGGGAGGGGGGAGVNTGGTYVSSGIGTVQIETNKDAQTVTPIQIRFEDLTSVEWAYKDISELFDKGIINGVSEHLFMPNSQVKREEFVKMIVCAMGLQYETAPDAGFTDVEKNAWYESYVNIAKKFGISNGNDDGTFGVGVGISRQDMAVMIYNAMKLKGYAPTGQTNTFSDRAMCAGYANEAIAELCSKGIITGVGDNLFDPTGEATRAQAAVIINRALPYLG